jgi:hypothetical protein
MRKIASRFLSAVCVVTTVLVFAWDRAPAAEERLADSAAAQGPSTAAVQKAEVSLEAIKALERMGTYLRTLKSFQVQSHMTRDELLDDGQRITFGGTIDLLLQRPNRFRAEVTTDKQQRFYFYDGKSFTLFARLLKVYTTVAAPQTLGALADELSDKYGLEVPLADLFHWGERTSDAIVGAVEVGPSQIGGTTCQHYAFRQEGVDWQVWIQQGDFPLPRKLVITTTSDDARPQYTSVMNWNLAPSYNDAAFTFVPPKDARSIAIRRIADDGGRE